MSSVTSAVSSDFSSVTSASSSQIPALPSSVADSRSFSTTVYGSSGSDGSLGNAPSTLALPAHYSDPARHVVTFPLVAATDAGCGWSGWYALGNVTAADNTAVSSSSKTREDEIKTREDEIIGVMGSLGGITLMELAFRRIWGA
ncbi:hypothetical protein EIP86_008138 [Pleurotus ostreatoroseus]|nr:hypothetical protein EIP86_008138 [Pleurotus ostreatoroseus]